MQNNNFSRGELKVFLTNQSNERIINDATKRVLIHDECVLINSDKYGNTTGATIPIGMDEAVYDGNIKEVYLVLTAAFGAGFTWGSMLIRWGK